MLKQSKDFYHLLCASVALWPIPCPDVVRFDLARVFVITSIPKLDRASLRLPGDKAVATDSHKPVGAHLTDEERKVNTPSALSSFGSLHPSGPRHPEA